VDYITIEQLVARLVLVTTTQAFYSTCSVYSSYFVQLIDRKFAV